MDCDLFDTTNRDHAYCRVAVILGCVAASLGWTEHDIHSCTGRTSRLDLLCHYRPFRDTDSRIDYEVMRLDAVAEIYTNGRMCASLSDGAR